MFEMPQIKFLLKFYSSSKLKTVRFNIYIDNTIMKTKILIAMFQNCSSDFFNFVYIQKHFFAKKNACKIWKEEYKNYNIG